MAVEMKITLDAETRAELVQAAASPRHIPGLTDQNSRMDYWINQAASEAVKEHILELLKTDAALANALESRVRELVGTLTNDDIVRDGLASAIHDWIRYRYEDRS